MKEEKEEEKKRRQKRRSERKEKKGREGFTYKRDRPWGLLNSSSYCFDSTK